ncbi:host attachment protein [Erythrobacter sp. GH1-10]|uniref:baeRF12 domain-containing protein n=1 Tax=Erythrobacter sp. GH1-10 TaxID=3349334 RepID=UPI0038780197
MKIGHGTLVLVADGQKLLLLRNEGDRKYAVLETLDHEEDTNPPAHEQGTDTPGRTHASVGERRSGYDETDWHERAEKQFAKNSANELERAADTHPDAGIVVIAAPQTLGVMRQHYGNATKERLVAEIDKDLAHHTTKEIAEVIAAYSNG